MMGCIIITDYDHERAVLYDSVTESAIEGISFIGPQALEHAGSFLAYLSTNHNQDIGLVYSDDPRRYTKEDLQAAHARWYELTLPDGEHLNDYGFALEQWLTEHPAYGAARTPGPEPDGYVPADQRQDSYELASSDHVIGLSTAEMNEAADALETLAGLDEGEHTDTDALLALARKFRLLLPQRERRS